MKNITIATILVCSLGMISSAHANNTSFGFGVPATVVATDNRAQPWLADQNTMRGKNKASMTTNKQGSAFYTSLQHKVKSWVKKINQETSTSTADALK